MSAERLVALTPFVENARWFGGKNRPLRLTGTQRLGSLDEPAEQEGAGEPFVVIDLVRVEYDDDEGGSDLYQLPLSLYREAQPHLEHAFLGAWETDLVLRVMLSNYLLKVLWEVVMTPFTYRIVNFLKRAESEDYFDRSTDFTPFSLRT